MLMTALIAHHFLLNDVEGTKNIGLKKLLTTTQQITALLPQIATFLYSIVILNDF
ncbi:hypothetical protein VRK_33910 [Vibrio sp. MEBiC08052]|nr:hypothetical protein VRK_33910 [Vibrio sp. MEBiC08052]